MEQPKIICNCPKQYFYQKNNVKNYDLKPPDPLYSLIFLMLFACDSYAVRMSFVCQSYALVYPSYTIRMSLVCTRILSVCHSYVSYVTRVSLVCTRMSFVCHSYVLACHPYVTRMYLYVIRMSLVCTRMSSVCHSYVLVCHLYVTRMWFYHEPPWTLNFGFCKYSCFFGMCFVQWVLRWFRFSFQGGLQDIAKSSDLEESIEIRLCREQKDSSGTSVFVRNTDFLVNMEMPTILNGRDELQDVTPRFFSLWILTKMNIPKHHKTYNVLMTYR